MFVAKKFLDKSLEFYLYFDVDIICNIKLFLTKRKFIIDFLEKELRKIIVVNI